MSRKTRLAAAFAIATGLTAGGVALAQTQTGSAGLPAVSAQPAPPPAQSTLPQVQSQTPTIRPWDPDPSKPTYSVDPPPASSSGLYLPEVIGGYATSVVGCVVIGCNDGPHVNGSSTPSSSGSAAPLPADLGPSGPR